MELIICLVMAYNLMIRRWIIPWILFFMNSDTIVMILGRDQQVPCLFFIGDSMSDNGNNNGRTTFAVANYPPYGIDYPYGPTGRFTNGRTVDDYIGELLGFDDPIPPFATATGSDILKGVNYASGGAGILEGTGAVLGYRITLSQQLMNHNLTITRLVALLGHDQVDEYLNKCLYVVNMGSNEYLGLYTLYGNTKARLMGEPNEYAQHLIQQYSPQLEALYRLGARKVAVFGLGLVGCVPEVLAGHQPNTSGCVDECNANVELFNQRLKQLVRNLNTNLADAKFTFVNVTGVLQCNLSAAGIKFRNSPCCKIAVTGLCVPSLAPCDDRDQFVFFDNFHPSQIINKMAADRAYKAISRTDAYPFDLQTLAQQ